MDTLTFTKAGRRPVKNVAINQDSLTRVTLRWPAGTENSPLGYCQSEQTTSCIQFSSPHHKRA